MYKVLLTEQEYKKLKHIRKINESTSMFKQVPSSFISLMQKANKELDTVDEFTKKDIENRLGVGSFLQLKKGEAVVEYNLGKLLTTISKYIDDDEWDSLDDDDGYWWPDSTVPDASVKNKIKSLVKDFVSAMGVGLGFEDAEPNYDDDTVAVRWEFQGEYPFQDNEDGTYTFNA